uniref:Phosphorylated carbohydrates phosphatase TM_1254 n=1 Tax=Anthurium amnicola TaxID=1678845 RepID=A0A1D1YX55_9ARAE
MVDSIAAATTTTSLIGHRPLYAGSPRRDGSSCRRRSDRCRLPGADFKGQRLVCASTSRVVASRQRPGGVVFFTVKSLATEVTKEANWSREGSRAPPNLGYTIGVGLDSTRLWPPPNKADNPALHNPLLRLERMGCGWLGVIFEWEGVVVEDDSNLEKQAWLALAQEEGKSPPPAFLLRRVEGVKNEQAISEVLCWSRDPSQVRRLAARKEEIHQGLQGGFYRLRPGSREFMSTLANHKIPIAVASTRPRKRLEAGIEAVGVEGSFHAIVAAEDVHRGKPDPEMFVYAAQLLSFIPERCIVFGNSNSTVEAAHDARMKCVAVASKHPVYELGAADLVVRRLDELSVVDLKNLADIDSPEFGEPELEMEEEQDAYPPKPTAVDDLRW